jgi:hypothetical protein
MIWYSSVSGKRGTKHRRDELSRRAVTVNFDVMDDHFGRHIEQFSTGHAKVVEAMDSIAKLAAHYSR